MPFLLAFFYKKCYNMAQEVGGIVFVTFNEKVDCLVDTIKELGRLPRMYDKDGTPECLFADETNQRAFYERVLGKYYLIRHKDAQNLTKNEVDTLNGCLKIREALDEIYIMKNQKNIEMLILIGLTELLD